MIFALDMDDGAVTALSFTDDAAARCKAIDVQDGYWRFFDEDGSPLEARFEPASPAGSVETPAAYILQRAMSGRWLQELLEQVTSVNGCGLSTVDELVETLKINRGKRVEQASRGARSK